MQLKAKPFKFIDEKSRLDSPRGGGAMIAKTFLEFSTSSLFKSYDDENDDDDDGDYKGFPRDVNIAGTSLCRTCTAPYPRCCTILYSTTPNA